jgi:hypothetical protein
VCPEKAKRQIRLLHQRNISRDLGKIDGIRDLAHRFHLSEKRIQAIVHRISEKRPARLKSILALLIPPCKPVVFRHAGVTTSPLQRLPVTGYIHLRICRTPVASWLMEFLHLSLREFSILKIDIDFDLFRKMMDSAFE